MSIENKSYPDIKVPTLRGANIEEFDIVFTAAVKIQNVLIRITLDQLLRSYAVGNYNTAWNMNGEKPNVCASLRR